MIDVSQGTRPLTYRDKAKTDWWLRSPGNNNNNAANVNNDGTVNNNGNNVNNNNGVRPAMP